MRQTAVKETTEFVIVPQELCGEGRSGQDVAEKTDHSWPNFSSGMGIW
jgi:hypothetical protein